MSRGEIQALITSLHVIRDELAPIKDEVPARVYAELSAVESWLKREIDRGPR